MADVSSRSELFAFADAFIERSAALDPIAATDYGIDRYDDELTDFSLAHAAETTDLLRSSLAALGAIVPADDIDRIGKEVMAERLDRLPGAGGVGRDEAHFLGAAVPGVADPAGVRHPTGREPRACREDPVPPRGRGHAPSRAGAVLSTRTPGGGLAAGPPSGARCGRPARHLRRRGLPRRGPAGRLVAAGWTPSPRVWPPPPPTPIRPAESWPQWLRTVYAPRARRTTPSAPSVTGRGPGTSPVPSSISSRSTNGDGRTSSASTPACGRSPPTWPPGRAHWSRWRRGSTPTRAGPSTGPTSCSSVCGV